jgi:xylose isomerase
MMKFATRINSFLNYGFDLPGTLEAIAGIRSDAAVDLNFPEHVRLSGSESVGPLLSNYGLSLNGMAVRYRADFIHGEFSATKNRRRAIDLAKETIDAIGELGGSVLTLWLSYDGNDYRFQDDYERSWDGVVGAFAEIADYARPLRLSLESKPYEPRSFSLLPTTTHALHLVDELNRDNVGITLDFCHSLMAGENPAFSLALILRKKRLFGVHLNDGYGRFDDGLMFGSVDPARAVEFMFYLVRAAYDGVIYFDTFPVREDPEEEFKKNVETVERVRRKLDEFGIDRIQAVIDERDGIKSQQLMTELFY